MDDFCTVASWDNKGRVIKQTRDRVFETLGRAFKTLGRAFSFFLNPQKLGRVFQKSNADLATQRLGRIF